MLNNEFQDEMRCKCAMDLPRFGFGTRGNMEMNPRHPRYTSDYQVRVIQSVGRTPPADLTCVDNVHLYNGSLNGLVVDRGFGLL